MPRTSCAIPSTRSSSAERTGSDLLPFGRLFRGGLRLGDGVGRGSGEALQFGSSPGGLGGALRMVVVWHTTWSVNSATHIWGYRNYETTDDSRNNWWVGLITYGEGWHNNHHAYPTSARHGHRWWEFDSSWLVIRTADVARPCDQGGAAVSEPRRRGERARRIRTAARHSLALLGRPNRICPASQPSGCGWEREAEDVVQVYVGLVVTVGGSEQAHDKDVVENNGDTTPPKAEQHGIAYRVNSNPFPESKAGHRDAREEHTIRCALATRKRRKRNQAGSPQAIGAGPTRACRA